MASASFRYTRELCWLFVLSVLTDISEEVSVQEASEPITARDSDSYVILPCDFRMETFETPQITWYQEILGERRLIMRYDIHNRLSSYGEFAKRLVRGDRGALVLLGPRSRDSGTYSCEVEVDNEIPSRVKSTVMLRVTKDSPIPKDEDAIILVSVYWLISVICALLLNARPRTLPKTACSRLRDMQRTQRTKHVFFSLVITMTMGLILAGVICAVKSVRKSESPTLSSYHWTASLITGVPGLLILSAITVWSFLPTDSCCKRKCSAKSGVQESHGEMPVQSTAVSCVFSTDTEGASCRLVRPVTNTPAVKAGFALLPKEMSKKLSEAITGMVCWSHKEAYVTTTGSLFKMNLADMAEERALFKPSAVDGKKFLSLAKYQDRLWVYVDSGDKAENETLRIFTYVRGHHGFGELMVKPHVKCPILWLQGDQRKRLLIGAFSNPNVINKRNLYKKTGEQIWKIVLTKPECIVQNSRGQFIVADSVKNDLFVFEADGEFLSTMKVSVPKEYEEKLSLCNRIAIDEDDGIFVSSPHSNDIVMFSNDFRFERLFTISIPSAPAISCLLVHNKSLYIAHGDTISVYALHAGMKKEEKEGV